MPQPDGPSRPPLAIQIAIQGGGAKLVLLLAALEALEEFVHDKRIKVTRIAGTSAGAITGALFAAGVPMGEVRQRLLGIGDRIRDVFPHFSKFRFGVRFLRNKPYWDISPLREMLEEFLGARHIRTFGDLSDKGVSFIAVRANLGESSAEYVSDPSRHVIPAVIDSSAVPFFFDSATGRGIVDGGVCENLPAEPLLKEPALGKVIAIAFDQEPANQQPKNWIESAKFLIGTVIENSMRRARQQLGKDRVLSLDPEFDMFNFEAALDALGSKGKQYEYAKEQARSFFRALLEQEARETTIIEGDPWKDVTRAMSERLVNVNNLLRKNQQIAIARTVITVQAKGRSTSDLGPDILSQDVFMRPQGPVASLSIGVLDVDYSLFVGRTSGRVTDADNATVPSEMFPVFDRGGARRLLFFFSPLVPLPPGKTYRLSVSQGMRNALPFRDDTDVFEFEGESVYGVVERVELVLLVPENHPPIAISALSADHSGRSMVDKECNAHQAPPGFRIHGWVGENVPPGTPFGIKLSLTRPVA